MNKKLFFSLLIAVLAAMFASKNPDGLDKVATLLGFASKATDHKTIMAGYSIPFFGNSKLSIVLTGVIGVLIIYCLFLIIISILKKHNNPTFKE